MNKRLYKYILMVFTLISSSFIGMKYVNAATNALIDINCYYKTVVIGKTFTVTVTSSSSVPIGGWEYSIKYNTKVLKMISGESNVLNYGDGKSKKFTETYTFKAIASGSSSLSVSSYRIINMDLESMKTTLSNDSINVITQEQLEASYSKDNTLKSLSVSGQTLTPTFNKNTLEYRVSLNSDVESINIAATKNDSAATMRGTGKKQVDEGENKFEIVVTAENGDEKTYTIIAVVEDPSPINVTIDDKNYVVVKRNSTLTAPSTFEATALNINEQTVPAFHSTITDYYLVGLKDENGDIGYYIYNEENNTYKLYKEIAFNTLTIYPLDLIESDLFYNYEKTSIIINEINVEAYKINKNSEYSIIYGTNIENGETNYYIYDSKENSIIRYTNEEVNIIEDKLEQYKFIMYILIGETGFLFLVLIIILINKQRKIKRRKQKLKEAKKEIKEEKELEKTKNIEVPEKKVNKKKEPKK